MNLINILKNFINKLFKKSEIKRIEPPKENKEVKNKFFLDSLKVEINNKKNKKKIIETLQCENDGLGFQKIKKY